MEMGEALKTMLCRCIADDRGQVGRRQATALKLDPDACVYSDFLNQCVKSISKIGTVSRSSVRNGLPDQAFTVWQAAQSKPALLRARAPWRR